MSQQKFLHKHEHIPNAVWLQMPKAHARRLLQGGSVRITRGHFDSSKASKPVGFIIQHQNLKKFHDVITKGKGFNFKLNPVEHAVNLHHSHHGIQVGEGFFDSIKSFASKAFNTVKDVGSKVYSVAQKVAKSPVGQALLKGVDMLAATEGVPPGLISGVTNTLLGVNSEGEPEEQEAEYEQGPATVETAPSGRSYSFPAPPVAPTKALKGGMFASQTYHAHQGGALPRLGGFKIGVESNPMNFAAPRSNAMVRPMSFAAPPMSGGGIREIQTSRGVRYHNGRHFVSKDAVQGSGLFLTT